MLWISDYVARKKTFHCCYSRRSASPVKGCDAVCTSSRAKCNALASAKKYYSSSGSMPINRQIAWSVYFNKNKRKKQERVYGDDLRAESSKSMAAERRWGIFAHRAEKRAFFVFILIDNFWAMIRMFPLFFSNFFFSCLSLSHWIQGQSRHSLIVCTTSKTQQPSGVDEKFSQREEMESEQEVARWRRVELFFSLGWWQSLGMGSLPQFIQFSSSQRVWCESQQHKNLFHPTIACVFRLLHAVDLSIPDAVCSFSAFILMIPMSFPIRERKWNWLFKMMTSNVCQKSFMTSECGVCDT